MNATPTCPSCLESVLLPEDGLCPRCGSVARRAAAQSGGQSAGEVAGPTTLAGFELRPTALFDLFLRPARYFRQRAVPVTWQVPALVAWLCGVRATASRLEGRVLLGRWRNGSSTAQEFYQGLLEDWQVYWVYLLVGGAVGGIFLWLLGGWWYAVRIGWSGASYPDRLQARIVYVVSGLVVALPYLVVLVAGTFLHPDYATALEAEDPWSMWLVLLPFWACVVSYFGVRARFDVGRWRAALWFWILPWTLYLVSAVGATALLMTSD